MTTILGRSVSQGAVQAAYTLSSFTGRKDVLDPEDLAGSFLWIKPKKETTAVKCDFDYRITERFATNGVQGDTVTRDEMTVFLQKLADRTQYPVVVILKTGETVTIDPVLKEQPLIADDPSDQSTFHKQFLRLVRDLSRQPATEVPFRLDRHLTPNYDYLDNSECLHPEKMWTIRTGDCGDYALFAYYVLKKAGYQPRYFQLFWPQDLKPGELPFTHDICVYRSMTTGRLNYFDEFSLNQCEASSLEELFNRARPDWNKAREQKVAFHDNWMIDMTTVNGPEFTYRASQR